MDAVALLRDAAGRLDAVGIDSPRLDAEVLLAQALGIGRTGLFARLRDAVDAAAAARFAALLERRLRREPVAYLTGRQEFWSLPFAVTPDVLIPRPETELLVELGVASVRAPRSTRIEILDVGTGSGCIAVALARALPAAGVTAVDLSAAALAVARRNAATHGVAARIALCVSDLFAALPSDATYDLIVANPPYLAPGDAASPELAFEPRGALYAGADGLAVIRALLDGAPSRLRPNGCLLMEFGDGQGGVVLDLARAAGFDAVHVHADLAAIPRILVAERGTEGNACR